MGVRWPRARWLETGAEVGVTGGRRKGALLMGVWVAGAGRQRGFLSDCSLQWGAGVMKALQISAASS